MIGILHVMEFPWDAAGQAEERPRRSAARGVARLGTRQHPRLHQSRVWSTHDRFAPNAVEARGRELIDIALAATPNWDTNYRKLFELSDPLAAFPIKIMTSEPVAAWEPTNVTLLGDAIHTMTPGQGVGANTALRDAALLCREFINVRAGEKSLLGAVADYEAEMLPYGTARVADSLDNNGTSADDPLYAQGFRGKAALLATRCYFSLTSRIPKTAPQIPRGGSPDLPGSRPSPLTAGKASPRLAPTQCVRTAASPQAN